MTERSKPRIVEPIEPGATEMTETVTASDVTPLNLNTRELLDDLDYIRTLVLTGEVTNLALVGVGFKPDGIFFRQRVQISEAMIPTMIGFIEKLKTELVLALDDAVVEQD